SISSSPSRSQPQSRTPQPLDIHRGISPSRRTAPTASKRTSSGSGGVPPVWGGRGGARWARRQASQASTVAGREERGQYAIGDQTFGQASRTSPWSGPCQRPDAPSITDTLNSRAGRPLLRQHDGDLNR